MEIGKLRHQIAIQSKTRTTDAVGGYTEAWATITGGTVWVSIVPVAGFEQYRADQLQEIVTHRITMRYLSGVTTAHRVLFGSIVYDIKSVINVQERGIEMVLLVEERMT